MSAAKSEPAVATIVVPCFDEARRLDLDAFRGFSETHPAYRFVLVNDGSRDGTLRLLQRLADESLSFTVLDLARNRGKAEAVRAGLLAALDATHATDGSAEINATHAPDTRPPFVGYLDADLSTPLSALPELLDVARAHDRFDVVMGARVQLLGRQIQRNPLRHYAGRIFATFASILLRMPVYDTQCGAKILRVRPSLEAALAVPFTSGWVFDVELLLRLAHERDRLGERPIDEAIYELPLHRWEDVQGSKVTFADFPRALVELERLRRRYRP
jgi:dolichyl-phosphate beta-glucosyltransferase